MCSKKWKPGWKRTSSQIRCKRGITIFAAIIHQGDSSRLLRAESNQIGEELRGSPVTPLHRRNAKSHHVIPEM